MRPFHPAFQLRVRRPDGDGPARGGYRRTLDFATGVARAGQGGWTSRVFVSRADDVIVQHLTGPGLTLGISLDHRLPNAPTGLGVGHGAVLTSEGALLSLRARYPGSDLAVTGVTLVAVGGGRTALTPPGVRVEGARSVLLLTRVRRHTGEADVVAESRALRDLLDGTPGTSYDDLLARHAAAHRTAYERVTLDLGAGPDERELPGSELLTRPRSAALLERLFAAGRYHLLSSSGLFPPRLTGLWTGDWDTAWSGAFTHDANLNLQTASAAAAALPEVTEALAALVRRQLPDWRDNARAVFGTRGSSHPPTATASRGTRTTSAASTRCTCGPPAPTGCSNPRRPRRDPGRARPGHRRRARRSRAVLRGLPHPHRQRGTTGRRPSYSPENRPANASWGAVNAAMDLSAARHALRTAAAYHPEHAERWRALADRLPPHRINADGALAEWAWPGLDDSYDHRHLSHLYGVWPWTRSPLRHPGPAAAAHRALELRGAENDSAHGHLHHALIAARLQDGERVAHALGRVVDGDFFHASLMSAHYPHRHVYNADAAHTLPAVLIEALVQSTPGRLVLLPAPLPDCPSGRLRGVRTRFGASLDLTWTPDGATAVLRPSRTHRIDLWTSAGAEPLDLVAGEDRVLTVKTR
ncbi:glycoside hydrolase N-terminal domain-containing protein [Streptomyces sp. KM77-8]|uniref:Glycoside hydrolase N-terminal domain-containing protein n=1 Tax=Streptomyces haneummycinicus TaxID=3074435 RepID=A0AAT9HEH7_9ACTN